MYTISHRKKATEKVVTLATSDQENYAEIALDLGASLQELTINKTSIIKPLAPLTYNNTYASSILFPFANRIKDGTYTFNNNTYTLPINEPDRNNALHGLVFNKTFEVIKEKATETYACITLLYEEKNRTEGFPYTYAIQLKYTLETNGLSLEVLIKNTDNKTFPFTTGWHPYFYSADLNKSSLHFASNTQLVFNERCITTGTMAVSNTANFDLKDKQLDDCFVLNNNDIQFNTPNYRLLISSSSEERFLQIYTPPKKNTIAIEPTTGVPDSFNNKMGLRTLLPKKTYQVHWNLKLI